MPARSLKNEVQAESVAKYLLANRGPDKDGYAYPNKKISIELLEAALNKAQRRELFRKQPLSPDFKPYHFKSVIGIYSRNDLYSKEVIVKRIDQIVREKFGNDFNKFLANIDYKTLAEPLTEVIDGHQVSTSLSCPLKVCHSSRFEAIQIYLEAKGLTEKYKDFKPWHLSGATPGYYEEHPAEIADLFERQILDIYRNKCGSDFVKFVTEIILKDILSERTEEIGGGEFKISIASLVPYLPDCSMLGCTKILLHALGDHETAKALRPNHLKQTEANYYRDNPEIAEAAVLDKMATMFHQCKGNLRELITTIDSDMLAAPYLELVGSHLLPVSPVAPLIEMFGSGYSVFEAVTCLIDALGLSEQYKSLGPQHLLRASKDTYTPEVATKIVKAKMKDLLDKTYHGDLGKFIAEVGYTDLSKGYVEVINGEEYPVSTHRALLKLAPGGEKSGTTGPALTAVVRSFLKDLGHADLAVKLEPYHLQAINRRDLDSKQFLAVVVGKVLKNSYDGDIYQLIRNIDSNDIANGFTDEVAGVKIVVATQGAFSHSAGSSPWEAVKVYLEREERHDILKWLKPYHLKITANGYYKNNPEEAKSLLVRHLTKILDETFKGDVEKMKIYTQYHDYAGELIEVHDGQEFPVSMRVPYYLAADNSKEKAFKILEEALRGRSGQVGVKLAMAGSSV